MPAHFDDSDPQGRLFSLPSLMAGSQAPRRPSVTPRAGFGLPITKPSRRARLQAMVAKAQERWKGFFEWAGFEKREIEVELIPGHKSRVSIPQGKPPKLILFRLLPDKVKGSFVTKPVTLWGNLARFDATLCEDLGLPIGRTTLWRLVYGGFVKAYRIAPMTTLVDLDSLLKHIAATTINGETAPFWTAEKITTYREWEKITPTLLERLAAESAAGQDGEESTGDE